MRVKINSTGGIKEVKQVGDKLFDKENNCYLLSQVTVLEEWRTASELPEKPTSKLGRIIVLTSDGKLGYNYYVDDWDMSNVKWWCYPPKED